MSIEDYEFSGDICPPKVLNANQTAVVLETIGKWLALDKNDAIALAKHFKLTAHDIECSEFKALQDYSNQADEDHWDECIKIQADKNKINKRLS